MIFCQDQQTIKQTDRGCKKMRSLWNRCSFILSKICIIVMFWARGLASEETYVDQVAQRESRPAKGDTRRRQVTSHAYLSNLADLFQVLSSIVKDCQRQVLSSIVKYWQVLSSHITCLSVKPGRSFPSIVLCLLSL